MPRRFEVRPTDDGGELVLYENPTFDFAPGVTVLVGCNRSGKTTLLRRMRDLLEEDGIPVSAVMRQQFESRLSALSYAGDLDAMTTQVSRGHTSEGEHAKMTIAGMLRGVGSSVQGARDEVWVLLDGLDSSMSEDQLDQLSDLADAIVETAPRGVETYVVMTTNQFTLARGRRALRVCDAREFKFETFDEYRDCILESAEAREGAKEVTEGTWQRRYSKIEDRTSRLA